MRFGRTEGGKAGGETVSYPSVPGALSWLVQGKGLHDPVDHSSLRGRIRTQALLEAAEECQQLANDDVDGREILVSQLLQPFALEHDIFFANKIGRDSFSDQVLQQTQSF